MISLFFFGNDDVFISAKQKRNNGLISFLTVNKNGIDKKRGLSKNQLCIVVSIDCHKNTYAVICGHGKPSASRIFEALKNHIDSGLILVHDGERAHNKLIKELDLKEEFYTANTHDKEYLENMALINNMYL